MMSNVCIYRTLSHVVIALCRPKRGSWHVLHRRKSGVRFTTYATGSWCGSTPLNKTGWRPIDTPTCSARRTSGPRYLMWQYLSLPCNDITDSFLYWNLSVAIFFPTSRPSMYFRKLPSWAWCQRKKWTSSMKMWWNYSGVKGRKW